MTNFTQILGKHVKPEDILTEAMAIVRGGPSTDILLAFTLAKAFERMEKMERQIEDLNGIVRTLGRKMDNWPPRY